MKYQYWLTGLCLLCSYHLWAQNDHIRVAAGEDAATVLTFKDRYLYPAFKIGVVHFKSGSQGSALMNYNLLFDEMHFIDPKGDTLAVTNEELFNYISLDADTFYFYKGYLSLIGGTKEAKLVKKDFLKKIDNQKIGGYDMAYPASSITNYQSFTADNKVYKLGIREDVIFGKRTVYFIGNQNNEFLIASKKNVLKLFPKQETAITSYLKQHDMDFKQEHDLEQLVQYIQSLL